MVDMVHQPAFDFVVLRKGVVCAGRIAATVSVRDSDTGAVSPKHARVDVLDDSTGALVGQAWSDPSTGAYQVRWLDQRRAHTALARDPDANFRPVAADRLMPEVG